MTEVLSDYASGSFTYTPLLGIPEYRSAVTELILPNASLPVASCATAGGTGSLAINLRMLKLLESNIRLCLPTPAWANHAPLCRSAGVAFEELAVLENGVVRCDVIIDWIRNTSGVRAILLQAGCTNPTGIDLSKDQWKEIMPVLKDSECIVLLDVAYQGFGSDPDTDAAPARGLVSEGIPVLISWSASKNHSVYRLRTGMALACVPDEHTRKRVEGHYSTLSRAFGLRHPISDKALSREHNRITRRNGWMTSHMCEVHWNGSAQFSERIFLKPFRPHWVVSVCLRLCRSPQSK